MSYNLPENFLERAKELEKQGYLSIRKHSTADLWIYNYTKTLQYEGKWCEISTICRGLIVDGRGTVVARPFPKFFNLEEHTEPLPEESFEVCEKMDGSLGILYWIEGIPYIATRGSFESIQAVAGTEILHRKYKDLPYEPGVTYLFEIIHSTSRVVVDYKGLEDLVLLAKIDTKTGKDLSLRMVSDYGNLPIVTHYDGITDYRDLRKLNEKNREGFVIRFSGGLRVKVKFEDYIRLHRLLTTVSEKVIWKMLSEGEDPYKLLNDVPDEFFNWFDTTVKKLNWMYLAILTKARKHLIHPLIESYRDGETSNTSRKEVAQYLLSQEYGSISFLLLDGKDYNTAIWKLCKPRAERLEYEGEDG